MVQIQKVREASGEFMVTQKGIANKHQFHLPKICNILIEVMV